MKETRARQPTHAVAAISAPRAATSSGRYDSINVHRTPKKHYQTVRRWVDPVRSTVFVLVFALIAPRLATAAVEYSNFGTGDSHGSTAESITGASTGSTYQSQADEFTAAFTGTITSIDVAAFGLSSDNVLLRLYANDASTNLPLASSRIELGDLAIAAAPGGVATLTLNTAVTLIGGNQYWLEMAPGNALTTVEWYSANNVLANPSAISIDASQSFKSDPVADVFRVNAAPIPEPETWWLMAVGVVFLLCLISRRSVRG